MKKVFKILVSFSFVLVVGLIVAYYNTSSLGYDNANILTVEVEQVRIFDYNIRYKDVKNAVENAREVLNVDFVSI